MFAGGEVPAVRERGFGGHRGESQPADEDGPAEALSADRRHELAGKWDALLTRIRALPGLSGFLRPPGERELLAAAVDGPVILVNVSPYRSDALAVTANGIRVIPLPELASDTAADLSERLAASLHALDAPRGSKEAMQAQEDIRRTLSRLWDLATGPVLDDLGLIAAPRDDQVWPRVWWSPGAALAALPLHAAGHESDGVMAAGRNALDHVVSSYTPTLRALMHAQTQSAAPSQKNPGVLVVAVPEAEGAAPLAAVEREVREITGVLSNATVHAGPTATSQTVREKLPGSAVAHFACHAVANSDHPSRSHLMLHDGPMTIWDISRLRSPEARLAYLSACSTVHSSHKLADESVHIVNAFQLAGFAHVVGSLWQLDDAVAARAAHGFYRRLYDSTSQLDGERTAEALHQIVQDLRRAYPRAPSMWAGLVQAGA
jgi:hypothetical protein